MDRAVQVRELGLRAIEDVLARNQAGRIAYAFGDRSEIRPVNYVYSAGWIYGRTSAGPKLQAILHNRWITFEVDEVDGLYDWRSVIVRGTFRPLPAATSGRGEGAWERGIKLLRRIAPEILTSDDPFPERWFLFRIAVQELTGRSCFSSTKLPERAAPAVQHDPLRRQPYRTARLRRSSPGRASQGALRSPPMDPSPPSA